MPVLLLSKERAWAPTRLYEWDVAKAANKQRAPFAASAPELDVHVD